jgi:hypothetical protein
MANDLEEQKSKSLDPRAPPKTSKSSTLRTPVRKKTLAKYPLYGLTLHLCKVLLRNRHRK